MKPGSLWLQSGHFTTAPKTSMTSVPFCKWSPSCPGCQLSPVHISLSLPPTSQAYIGLSPVHLQNLRQRNMHQRLMASNGWSVISTKRQGLWTQQDQPRCPACLRPWFFPQPLLPGEKLVRGQKANTEGVHLSPKCSPGCPLITTTVLGVDRGRRASEEGSKHTWKQ